MFERRLVGKLLGSNGVSSNLLFPLPRLIQMRIGKCAASRLHERSELPQIGWPTCTLVNGLRVSHNGTVIDANHLDILVASEKARIF